MKVTTACLSSRRTLSMNHIKAHTLSLHSRAGLNPAWVSGSRSSSTAISLCATTAKSSLYEWQRKQSLYYGPFLHRECFFGKCMVILHGAVSSLLGRSKCFTLHFLADLLILTPTRLPRCSCYVKTIHSHSHNCSQVLIYTAKLNGASRRERKCPNF